MKRTISRSTTSKSLVLQYRASLIALGIFILFGVFLYIKGTSTSGRAIDQDVEGDLARAQEEIQRLLGVENTLLGQIEFWRAELRTLESQTARIEGEQKSLSDRILNFMIEQDRLAREREKIQNKINTLRMDHVLGELDCMPDGTEESLLQCEAENQARSEREAQWQEYQTQLNTVTLSLQEAEQQLADAHRNKLTTDADSRTISLQKSTIRSRITGIREELELVLEALAKTREQEHQLLRSISDTDDDGVSMIDSPSDNCPDSHNDDQLDSDGDGVGDACDVNPSGEDNCLHIDSLRSSDCPAGTSSSGIVGEKQLCCLPCGNGVVEKKTFVLGRTPVTLQEQCDYTPLVPLVLLSGPEYQRTTKKEDRIACVDCLQTKKMFTNCKRLGPSDSQEVCASKKIIADGLTGGNLGGSEWTAVASWKTYEDGDWVCCERNTHNMPAYYFAPPGCARTNAQLAENWQDQVTCMKKFYTCPLASGTFDHVGLRRTLPWTKPTNLYTAEERNLCSAEKVETCPAPNAYAITAETNNRVVFGKTAECYCSDGISLAPNFILNAA